MFGSIFAILRSRSILMTAGCCDLRGAVIKPDRTTKVRSSFSVFIGITSRRRSQEVCSAAPIAAPPSRPKEQALQRLNKEDPLLAAQGQRNKPLLRDA